MNNTHYIAITIGPIYKTFLKAEKTREIWGASYLFSYLCRNLVKEFNNKGFQILLPSPDAVSPDAVSLSKPGVGLYPDRIMLRIGEKDVAEVTAIVKGTKEKLGKRIYQSILKYPACDPYARLLARHVKRSSKSAVLAFLESYLQVYSVSVEGSFVKLDGLDKTGKAIQLSEVISMNVMLDHAELRASIASFDPDPIKVFLRGINHSFLLHDAFDSKFKHFPSFPEITTTELRFVGGHQQSYDEIIADNYDEAVDKEAQEMEAYNADAKDFEEQNVPEEQEDAEREMPSDLREDDILDLIFQLPEADKFKRTYHKYVAIVHADGDRMGKLIGSLKTTKDIQNFSKDLLRFAQDANKVIAGTRFTAGSEDDWGYGGAPIYIGGDDLVFFAPVACRDKAGNYQTFFDLIARIDETFNEIFNAKKDNGAFKKYEDVKAEKRPCMTYGVSITYVKYPLREAYQQSYELMSTVKNDDYKSRNRVNFKVRKHSGQWFGGVIDKNDETAWEAIRKLLEENRAKKLTGSEAAGFINSVSHKLRFYQSAIKARVKVETRDELQVSMTALFDNAFDEDVHGNEEVRKYLNSIRDLLVQMLHTAKGSEGRTPEARIEEALDTLHGILRFIHFVRDDEFKNENKKKYEAPVHS